MDELEEKSYNFSLEVGNIVQCELAKLIDKIYVSPKSSKEVVDKVKSLVEQFVFLKGKVIQSDLYKDFIY